MQRASTIPAGEYYGEYYGHRIPHLQQVFDTRVAAQRARGENVRVAWLVGDSSLDNKFWFNDRQPSANGMEKILSPAISTSDVASHLNAMIDEERCKNKNNQTTSSATTSSFFCMNCAVEESTIGDRQRGTKLNRQDAFVAQHFQEGDALICSVGGNDIALKPTLLTIIAMLWLVFVARTSNIKKGTAWGLGHFKTLLVDDMASYLRALLRNVQSSQYQQPQGGSNGGRPSSSTTIVPPPSKRTTIVLSCVVYYLDKNSNAKSWANRTLSLIRYNSNPEKVHAIIDQLAVMTKQHVTCETLGLVAVKKNSATSAVATTTTTTATQDEQSSSSFHVVEWAKVLDGNNTADYVARVEPSAAGGKKMASLLQWYLNYAQA